MAGHITEHDVERYALRYRDLSESNTSTLLRLSALTIGRLSGVGAPLKWKPAQ
jgi:hypothetical protein